jgi:DNA replication and repair protein RecF
MITKIHLSNFRNFKDKIFEFSPETTVILGPNASGKTNILESIYLLSTGKSFKAKIEEEMLSYKQEIARVKGKIHQAESSLILEVILTRGEVGLGTARAEKVARKRLLINGVSKRLTDFVGTFHITLFAPQEMDLVTASPSLRRKFLDMVLSQIDREYRRASLSYEKGLRQRNRILLKIRDEGAPRNHLLFWDKLLIKNGDYLTKKRAELIDFINATPSLNDQKFLISYDKSAISESRLEDYKNEEVYAGMTLVGPHRDDFIFKMKARDLAKYGSRGEQRMAVLWLKLAELLFIEKVSGEKPTLLLDDIFSELDHEHRDVVIKLASQQQTIITSADPHYIEPLKAIERIDLIN